LRESGISTCSAATVPDCSVGFIYLPALLAVASTSMVFAPLGARAAHTLDSRSLSRIFALLLYLLAGYMLYKGVRTL
jgi:uncharacterized membrane protein YfcA